MVATTEERGKLVIINNYYYPKDYNDYYNIVIIIRMMTNHTYLLSIINIDDYDLGGAIYCPYSSGFLSLCTQINQMIGKAAGTFSWGGCMVKV